MNYTINAGRADWYGALHTDDADTDDDIRAAAARLDALLATLPARTPCSRERATAHASAAAPPVQARVVVEGRDYTDDLPTLADRLTTIVECNPAQYKSVYAVLCDADDVQLPPEVQDAARAYALSRGQVRNIWGRLYPSGYQKSKK